MKIKSIDVLILAALLWAGMIAGISFLEAPVKFTAPSLTLPVGLDVGRHVFQAFNKVEIVFGTILLILIFAGHLALKIRILIFGILMLLALQCFWLLPILDERAIVIISGRTPAGESPHIWYIIFDALKLMGLLTSAILCLKEKRLNNQT